MVVVREHFRRAGKVSPEPLRGYWYDSLLVCEPLGAVCTSSSALVLHRNGLPGRLLLNFVWHLHAVSPHR